MVRPVSRSLGYGEDSPQSAFFTTKLSTCRFVLTESISSCGLRAISTFCIEKRPASPSATAPGSPNLLESPQYCRLKCSKFVFRSAKCVIQAAAVSVITSKP